MSFIQIMELQTSAVEEMQTAVAEWDAATQGKRTARQRVLCQDRDRSGRYFVVVFFDSYEDAMKNSALPETDALSKKVARLADSGPFFYNLDVIEERS